MVKELRLGWPKTMDFEVVFQAIEANLTSSTRRVSGELGFSHNSVIGHLHHHYKKYPELPICVTRNENIAKLLTLPCNSIYWKYSAIDPSPTSEVLVNKMNPVPFRLPKLSSNEPIKL